MTFPRLTCQPVGPQWIVPNTSPPYLPQGLAAVPKSKILTNKVQPITHYHSLTIWLRNRFHVTVHLLMIDHMWCQNVVSTKKWHTRHSQMPHWWSYHILMFSGTYYCKEPLQHKIYLLYMRKEQNFSRGEISYMSVYQYIINKNQSKCMWDSAYHIMPTNKLL